MLAAPITGIVAPNQSSGVFGALASLQVNMQTSITIK
jgi:hypothetical protein